MHLQHIAATIAAASPLEAGPRCERLPPDSISQLDGGRAAGGVAGVGEPVVRVAHRLRIVGGDGHREGAHALKFKVSICVQFKC